MKTNVGVSFGRVAVLAAVLLSLALPALAQGFVTVNITSDRQRQVPGGPIRFTDLSTPQNIIAQWNWDFGDGSTGPERNARNPVHNYAAPGVYTVTLQVVTQDGLIFNGPEEEYTVEILDAPFADFEGRPREGVPPLSVDFFDRSVTAGTNLTITDYLWDFGDDTPLLTGRANPTHAYQDAGNYTVTLTVTFSDGSQDTVTKEEYIVVEETDEPATSFEANIEIRDTESILPLSDWIPLFSFSMTFGDDPGFRYLANLSFIVTGDQNDNDEDWIEGPGPAVDDLLDFCIFLYDTEAETFQEGVMEQMVVWDNTGAPLGTVSGGRGSLRYNLDFIGNGSESDPQFPIQAWGGDNPPAYLVCVRPSALWHTNWTLGVTVTGAFMVNPFGDLPEDNYPEFPVEAEVGYHSSFGVWDWTQGPFHGADADTENGNAWVYPRHLYTPLAEHSRPRWDLPGNVFEFVAGELLDLRQLFPIESWVHVVGINAHSTAPIHWFDPLAPDPNTSFYLDGPSLREVNMVFTDIGGSEVAGAGSGGFDPRLQLDPGTGTWTEIGDEAHTAIGTDFTFNGVWVFYDTNQNGVFDPPVPRAGGGVDLVDDPMIPDAAFFGDAGTPGQVDQFKDRWQYISNPPGGGDPWWRIKLRLDGTRRRNPGEEPLGLLEPTPDVFTDEAFSDMSLDYFVVMRADSGFQDISLVPGDGNGYIPGADFKAFVEPRWFDPVQGHWQGGVYFDAMISAPGEIVADRVITAWQDDIRWLPDEPWWTERTANAMTTKPMRGGFEVHDYVLLYNSNNRYARETNINYSFNWAAWLDPFGSISGQFFYGDSPFVVNWSTDTADIVAGLDAPWIQDDFIAFGFPFETVPFFNPTFDGDIVGPRSPVYQFPPQQPALPTYDTWNPNALEPGEYPSIFNWAPGDVRARYLKQRIDVSSIHTPILGINLVGSDDPITNRVNARYVNDLYIAFWGPDFTPSDLMPLDASGISPESGVQLRVDNGPVIGADDDLIDGSYFNIAGVYEPDTPLTLRDLAWPEKKELIDIDGDGVADDMNGDGQITDADRAWVLRLTPAQPWLVPSSDEINFNVAFGGVEESTGGGGTGGGGGGGGTGGGIGGGIGGGDDDDEELNATRNGDSILLNFGARGGTKDLSAVTGPVTKTVKTTVTADGKTKNVIKSPAIVTEGAEAAARTKALKAVPADLWGNPGDDLFVVIKTSPTMKRFEQFRCVVPATRPEQPEINRQAGIRMTPGTTLSAGALQKVNPDEGPVQDYHFHDMMEVNVPVVLTDMTGPGQNITQTSDPLAVIGIDVSTNRGAAGVAARGSSGVGGSGTFTVTGAGWTAGAFIGDFLIDANYEAFEIVGNTESVLTLRGGRPANGAWFIARDPTFLEQVIVELYDFGADGQFNILQDLMPLHIDQTLSGVAIYRDNDADPANNRNGQFDPGIDIPLTLDDAPMLIGQQGEPNNQVLFVFSSPGTDDVPAPLGEQPRLRQWIPDSFGSPQEPLNPDTGPDFFIVVRTSSNITVGDDFTAGIVSWGPDTPTQPDPDTFTGPEVPLTHKDDQSLFVEFPWGSRALGFITFFKEPPDDSGFNWIRSSAVKNIQTKPVTAISSGQQAGALTLTSIQPSLIPTVIEEGGMTLTLTGTGFGTAPRVLFNGSQVQVTSSTDTSIQVSLQAGATFPAGPVEVLVNDTTRGRQVENLTLLRAVEGDVPEAPVITGVSPAAGGREDFPVTVFGTGFVSPEVRFGGTKMPIASVNPQGTQIVVNFPPGGLALTGPMDVEVSSTFQVDGAMLTLKGVRPNGFNYTNPPTGAKACFIATAAYGTPFENRLDTFRGFRDNVLLKSAAGTALVDAYYTVSPSLADRVAAHPWLAALVRLVLTPVALVLELPALLLAPAGVLALAAVARRRLKMQTETR